MAHAEQMQQAAAHVLELIKMVHPDQNYSIQFVKIDEGNITKFGGWDIERLGLFTGNEYYFISTVGDGHVIYAVNVTADSLLTAAYELMELVHRKF